MTDDLERPADVTTSEEDSGVRFDDPWWDDAFCVWWDSGLRTCCS